MTALQINNFTAEITETGLENNNLPTNDALYTYTFGRPEDTTAYWVVEVQDLAKNNWKNRDRMGCIKELASNLASRVN